MKDFFDKKARDISLQGGYLVLSWDVRRVEKGKHGKFDPLWFAPFKISKAKGSDDFLQENLDGEVLEFLVNEKFLKLYFQH